jgi:uncharacterized SAM-binding protein YcdF (DUF218 family)
VLKTTHKTFISDFVTAPRAQRGGRSNLLARTLRMVSSLGLPGVCSNCEVAWLSSRPAKLLRTSWIIGSSLFTLCYLAVTLLPIDAWYARLLSGNWEYGQEGTLIVLAADSQPDGLVGSTSYWRALYTVRAWRAGHFQHILVSGGPVGKGQSPLASAVAEFLIGESVPKEAIWLEERSHTTHEQAVYTALLLGNVAGKKTLLTSDQHMFRAKRAFERQGVEVSAMPIPDTLKRCSNPAERFQLACGLAVESIKIVYYKARGWI